MEVSRETLAGVASVFDIVNDDFDFFGNGLEDGDEVRVFVEALQLNDDFHNSVHHSLVVEKRGKADLQVGEVVEDGDSIEESKSELHSVYQF